MHCSLHYVGVPLGEFWLLVMVDLFYQDQIFGFYLFVVLFLEFVLVLVEFDDWAFHALNQRFCPAYYTSNWRLTSADYSTVITILVRCLSFNKKLLICIQLLFVTIQHISVFSLQSFRDLIQSLNRLEIVQQIKSSFTWS